MSTPVLKIIVKMEPVLLTETVIPAPVRSTTVELSAKSVSITNSSESVLKLIRILIKISSFDNNFELW